MKNYLLLILLVFWAIPASADTKTIEADYSLVMGDNMSKREARRICLAEAKRKLVEQAGVWLESETTIKNFKLAKDEIRLFSAAFISPVIIVEQSEKVDGSTFRFYTKVRANVSPERIRSKILDTHKYGGLIVRLAKLEEAAEKQRKIKDSRVGEIAHLKQQVEDIEKNIAKGASRNKIEKEVSAAEWFDRAYDLHFQMIEKWEEKHDSINEVIRLYSKAIEINPRFVEAYNNRGIVYGRKGNYDLAIRDYTKAIEIDPTYFEAYVYRGGACSLKGDYDVAIRDYTKAIEINPRYAMAYFGRGFSWDKKENYDLSIRDYTKAIEINPRFVEAYSFRGGSHDGLGNHDQAIRDYTKAIEIDPTYFEAYVGRGGACSLKGNYDLAIRDYTKAIEINPGHAQLYTSRGFAHKELGNHDQAIRDYTEAIEINPGFAMAYYSLGIAFGKTGNYDEAVRNQKKACELGFQSACERMQLDLMLKELLDNAGRLAGIRGDLVERCKGDSGKMSVVSEAIKIIDNTATVIVDAVKALTASMPIREEHTGLIERVIKLIGVDILSLEILYGGIEAAIPQLSAESYLISKSVNILVASCGLFGSIMEQSNSEVKDKRKQGGLR